MDKTKDDKQKGEPKKKPDETTAEDVQVDDKNLQIVDLKSRLARALADYDNLRKRTDEEKKFIVEIGKLNLLTKLFPILDNLERAFEATKDAGVGLVLKQFTDLLTSEGLKEMAVGGQFDPNLHEAVASEMAEEDNKILKVLEKGYLLNDKVVRAAKVVVGQRSGEVGENPTS